MNAWNFIDDSSSSSNGSAVSRGGIQLSKREAGNSFQMKKHAFFTDDGGNSTAFEATSSSNTGSRRKQASGRKELVLEDDDDSGGDNGAIAGGEPQSRGQSSREDDKQSRIAKAVAIPETAAIPDVIHTVLCSKVTQQNKQQSSIMDSSSVSSSPSTTSTATSKKMKRVSLSVDAPLDSDQFLHYLVREFLALHVGDSAVMALFDKERQTTCVLDDKEAKKLFERVTGRKDASSRDRGSGSSLSSSSSTPQSLLEQFIFAWDEVAHGRKCERSTSSSSSRHSSSSSSRQSERSENAAVAGGEATAKKTSSSSTTRKKKPALNVITATEELDMVGTLASDGNDSGEGDYNCLNHPGSTPKPQGTDASAAIAACILGDPGSTPKASMSDLRTLGFDEDELRTPVPVENISGSATSDTTVAVSARSDEDDRELSEYAKRKRAAKKHTKRVWIGKSGSTPTKEYIFFRETPPSFVTESIEAAIEVLEQLGLDPVFRVQAAAPQERFIELSSSEVSKYQVGQAVQSLGAQRNVSGVVDKIFGSRQCGTSGPGTIVIDTCPDSSRDTNRAGGNTDTSGFNSAPAAASKATSSVMPAPAAAFDPEDESLMDELLS